MKKVLILFSFLAFIQALSSAEMKQQMIGEAAPAFRLLSLDGKPVSLADFQGKVVVLHFGAGW
jgi:cytochrome oxidase Cu insertion factor (SCO1/SenC/PrrC family)